jgi:hypothetical protein
VLVWGLGPQGSFFGLVQFVRCKDALTADLLKLSSDSHQWNVSFLRVAQDGSWIFLLCYTSDDCITGSSNIKS